MSVQRQAQPVSEKEYWALNETSAVKLEFLRGQVVQWNNEATAMVGSTPNHARLTANIIAALGALLRDRECYVTSSDQLVRCEETGENAYPDATVICPPERFDAENPLALLNPTALFEVLSPFTAEKDLTTKSDTYFRIDSLHHYLIISQDQVRVELRSRGDMGWETNVFNRPQDKIELPILNIGLSVAEIYRGLNLPSLSLVPLL
jgi:Uma2 family endonuclease